MDLAFNSDSPYVTPDRWIASLSDGSTVFEDQPPGKLSAWQRLKTYLKENRLFITRLRLQLNNTLIQLPPLKGMDGFRQLQGYWQSRRAIRTSYSVDTIYEHGIGYIKDNSIHITWAKYDSSNTELEVRPFDPNKDLAAILYDQI